MLNYIKNLSIYILILVSLILMTGIKPAHAESEGKIIIYVATGCPHCANVERYVEKNELSEKIEFRDIALNTEYEKSMFEMFAKFGIEKNDPRVGWPVMEYNGEIVSGDIPIINVLAELYGKPSEVPKPEVSAAGQIIVVSLLVIITVGLIAYGAKKDKRA